MIALTGWLATGAVVVVTGIALVGWAGLKAARRLAGRLDRMEERLARELQTTFEQLEALQSLHVELQLEASLPATRGWAGSPDFLLQVARHVRQTKPAAVVECSSGVSTIVIARALQLNGGGHVVSLEHDPQFAEVTRNHLCRHGLSDWASVVDAPLVKQAVKGAQWNWYTIDGIPSEPIDMVVIDGPPLATNPLARYPAGPFLFNRLNQGGAVFLDDADRDDETQAVERWSREFPHVRWSRVPTEKGLAVGRA